MNVLLDKLEERFQRSNRVFDSGMVLTEMVRISSE